MENKIHVTVVVSAAANDNILSFQVIFQGLILRSFPPKNGEHIVCKDNVWHLTFSSNNWSTLNAYKNFVNNILFNYRTSQINLLVLFTYRNIIASLFLNHSKKRKTKKFQAIKNEIMENYIIKRMKIQKVG
jgi:hypothetical protein